MIQDKNYIGINVDKLRDDVKKKCKKTGKSMSRELIVGGLTDSLFGNATSNYNSHRAEMQATYVSCKSPGRIDESRYLTCISIFGLSDKYRLATIGEMIQDAKEHLVIEAKPNNDTALIEELAGIKSELKDVNESIDNLSYVLLQILEKMPTAKIKPVALLDEKKEVSNG